MSRDEAVDSTLLPKIISRTYGEVLTFTPALTFTYFHPPLTSDHQKQKKIPLAHCLSQPVILRVGKKILPIQKVTCCENARKI